MTKDSGGSAVVGQLTHDPRLKGLNPATDDYGRVLYQGILKGEISLYHLPTI